MRIGQRQVWHVCACVVMTAFVFCCVGLWGGEVDGAFAQDEFTGGETFVVQVGGVDRYLAEAFVPAAGKAGPVSAVNKAEHEEGTVQTGATERSGKGNVGEQGTGKTLLVAAEQSADAKTGTIKENAAPDLRAKSVGKISADSGRKKLKRELENKAGRAAAKQKLEESLIDRLKRRTRSSSKAVQGSKLKSSGSVRIISGKKKMKNTSRVLQPARRQSGSGLVVAPAAVKGATGTSSTIRLFNTVAFRGPLKALPKWSRVMRDVRQRGGTLSKALPVSGRKPWMAFKKEIQGLDTEELLRRVNVYFNKWPYRLDLEIYGVSDYWATPAEFVMKSGDCEDYSISKYYALKELGISPDNMRIVALKDRIRNIGHAVLVVYHAGQALVLDNQTNLVFPHSRYTHYVPFYSVNEKFRWAHVPAR